ncbi:MAG TPA: GNVR domain-containing protein [Anaerolineales bacterium]|nr:GNVR domain-containing protein [Anaerolineales bacterium]
MELKEFAQLMWRGARFLALGLILGVMLGLAAAVIQAPDYEAVTRVLISRPRQQTSVDLLPLSEDQLVSTNALMVKTKPVLDDASYELGAKINPDNIVVTVIPNTLIIQIKVQDQDPKQAAAIANTLVKILIQQNDDIMASRFAASETALTGQIDQVQKQIDSLQSQYTQLNDASIQEQLKLVNQQTDLLKSSIASLEQDINNFPLTLSVADQAALAAKQAQLEQDRSLLNLYQQIQVNLTFTGQPGTGGATREIPSITNVQSNINLYQQIYLALQNSLEANRSDRTLNTPNILQIDPAVAPKAPVRPLPVLYVLFGGLVGFALAAGILLVMDHVNNPVKHARQAEEVLKLPVLADVSDTGRSKKGLLTIARPSSAEAEAFRALGAAIETGHGKTKPATLMIVNAAEGEARSSIAANLAVVYAQQGREVALVDGDIRHPHLHELFGRPNQAGLANMLDESQALPRVGDCIEEIDGLTLIPSGTAPDQTTRWMNAEKWSMVLSRLRSPMGLVIVDAASPETADAQTLASEVDAVLLVIRAAQTPTESAQSTLRRLQSSGATVLGAVLCHGRNVQSLRSQVSSWRNVSKHRKEEPSAANGLIDETSTPAS